MVQEIFWFSSDHGTVTRKDIEETSRLSEDFFETQGDPSQVATSPENKAFIFSSLQKYLNIIKKEDRVIGYAFVLPSTKETMNAFLEERITEAEVFERVHHLDLTLDPEALYLCAAVIDKNYRGQGLATQAFEKLLEKLTSHLKIKPFLYAWIYSEDGKRIFEARKSYLERAGFLMYMRS